MKKIHLLKEPNLMAKYNAFPYQQEAFDAVKDLEYAAIFHEQGLGKTKIAIDVLLYWLQNTDIDTALIVTKKHTGRFEFYLLYYDGTSLYYAWYGADIYLVI